MVKKRKKKSKFFIKRNLLFLLYLLKRFFWEFQKNSINSDFPDRPHKKSMGENDMLITELYTYDVITSRKFNIFSLQNNKSNKYKLKCSCFGNRQQLMTWITCQLLQPTQNRQLCANSNILNKLWTYQDCLQLQSESMNDTWYAIAR
jgi:hypothetical protein